MRFSGEEILYYFKKKCKRFTCFIMTLLVVYCGVAIEPAAILNGTGSVFKLDNAICAGTEETPFTGSIAAGDYHMLVLADDGTVKVWGRNIDYQLGIGNTTDKTTPTTIPGLTDIMQLAAGGSHSFALTGNGTVKAWGYGGNGQLGFGSATNIATPTTIPDLTNIKQLAAGSKHSFALTEGGTVRAWGYNGYGQLGLGDTITRNVPTTIPNLSGVKQIAVGENFSLALLENGTVKAWGYNAYGQLGMGDTINITVPTIIPGLSGVKQLAAGRLFVIALLEDGTVKAWGYNNFGQLGLGDTTNRNVPTTIPGLSGVKQIAAGSIHALALLGNNTVKAWGRNYDGQLGDGTTTNRKTPVAINTISEIKGICAGGSQSYSFSKDKTLYSWGNNDYGQLGIGDKTQRVAPAVIPGIKISCGKPEIMVISPMQYHTFTDKDIGFIARISVYDEETDLLICKMYIDNETVQRDTKTVKVTPGSYLYTEVDFNPVDMSKFAEGLHTMIFYISNGAVSERKTISFTVDKASAEGGMAIVPDSEVMTVTAAPSDASPSLASKPYRVKVYKNGSLIDDSGMISESSNPVTGESKVVSGPYTTGGNGGRKLVKLSNGWLAAGAVYSTSQIEFYVSKDNGATWSQMAYRTTGTKVNGLALSAAGNTLHYLTTTDTGVFYGKIDTATASGQNITTESVTLAAQTAVDSCSVVTGADGHLHAVWSEKNPTVNSNSYNLNYMESTDGGASWGGNWTTTLNTAGADWTLPCIVSMQDGNPVIFAQYSDMASKAIKCFVNNGSVWGSESTVYNGGTYNQTNPCAVAGSDGKLHVVWEGTDCIDSSVTNIRYACSSNGTNWTGAVKKFTSGNSYPQTGASITADNSNNIYVMWCGRSSGAYNQIRKTEYKSGEWSTASNLTSNTSNHATAPSLCDNSGFSEPPYIYSDAQASQVRYSGAVNTSVSYTTKTPLTPNTRYNVKLEITSISGAIQSQEKEICTLADAPIIESRRTKPNEAIVALSDKNPSDTMYMVMCGNDYADEKGGLTSIPIWIPISTKSLTVKDIQEDMDYIIKVKARNEDGAETDFAVTTIAAEYDANYMDNQEILPTIQTKIAAIAAGGYHTIAMSNDGRVWTWGNNSLGQLGFETGANSSTPVQVESLNGIIAIAGGRNHSIALKDDGTVWTWGYNNCGQLGDGTTTNRSTPIQVAGLNGIIAIAGGGNHTIALKNDGTVWAWGYNNYGQLGNGTTTNRSTPVQVVWLNGIIAIAGGENHTIALKNDGTVWAWGYNSQGQLGDETTTNRSAPVQVAGFNGVSAIACGENHTIVLLNDGTVWTCGYNYLGQLGDGTFVSRSTLTQVISIYGVIDIAGGDYHSIALKNDGTVWGWGYGGYGQLGYGVVAELRCNTPLYVYGTYGATAIATGSHHTVSLGNGGAVRTLGANSYGQLGNGSLADSSYPTEIELELGECIPNLYVSSVSSLSLNLSWQSIDGALSYKIERDGYTSFNLSGTSMTDNDLMPNRQYTYRVRAVTEEGYGLWSKPISTYTLANIPIKDSLGPSPDGGIKASWDANGNPIGTEYALAAFNSNGALIRQNSWTTNLAGTLKGLSASSSYNIKVRARNGDKVETDWCELGCAMPTPVAPTIASLTPYGTFAEITWASVSGAVWYDIEADGVVTEKAIVTKDISSNCIYKHTGLKPLSQHTYRVRARNISGAGEWSNLLIVMTSSGIPTSAPNINPNPPRYTNSTITLAWDEVIDAETYEVAEVSDGLIKQVINNGTATICEKRGLAPLGSYTYKVRAKNSIAAGPWSDPVTVTTCLLETPGNITTVESDDSIMFSWSAVADATGYELKIDEITVIVVTGTEYTLSDLTENLKMSYSIRALNVNGESAWSLEAPAYTLPVKPDIPENVSATVSDTAITISWDEVKHSDGSRLVSPEGYDVELNGVILENDTSTIYIHNELEPYTMHTYRVRARNMAVEGDWSTTQRIRTLPGKPKAPQGVLVVSTQTGATLSWEAEQGATGYDIEMFDGNTVEDITNLSKTSYTHRRIQVGYECKYRIRTRNAQGISDWSGYIVNNAIKAMCTRKKTVDLGLTAADVMDFSPYTMVVTYNPGVIDVVDLCTLSEQIVTTAGKIEGTEIEILETIPGRIVFKVNKVITPGEAWTGVINSIMFKAKETGGTTITYTVFCEPAQ